MEEAEKWSFFKQDYSGEPVIQEDERELNAKGTVDNVVSYQFLCTP